jgi:PKD repeat protein
MKYTNLLLFLIFLFGAGTRLSGQCPFFVDFSWQVGTDGLTVTFTNESLGGDNPQFNWTFGDGSGTNNQTVAVNPVHIYADYGDYVVILKGTDGTGANALTITVEHVIHLQTVSPTSMWVTLDGPTVAAQCQNVALSVHVSGGIPPYTYEWTFEEMYHSPTGCLATVPPSNLSHQYFGNATENATFKTTGITTTRVRVKVTDAAGTYDDHLYKDIKVKDNVSLEIRDIGEKLCNSNSNYCVNAQILFSPLATPLTNFEYPTNYYWDFGDGSTFVDNFDGGGVHLHAYATNGAKTVTLRVEDPNGSMQVSKVINVGNVDAPPQSNLPCVLSITTSNVTNSSNLTLLDYPTDSPLPSSAVVTFNNGTGTKKCFNMSPYYFWTVQMGGDCYNYNKTILNNFFNSTSSTLPFNLVTQDWWNVNTNNEKPWGTVSITGFVRETSSPTASNCCIALNNSLIYIKPSELEVSELEVTGTCQSYQLSATVSGGGWRKDTENGPHTYKQYDWEVYNLKNPDEKVEGILTQLPEKYKCSIDLNHPYFDNFAVNENFEFLVKLTVTDFANQRVETNQLVSFNPLRITLKPNITRCPSVVSHFSENPLGSGGTPTYKYDWAPLIIDQVENIFTASSTIGSETAYTVTVTDAQGCTAVGQTTVKIVPLDLTSMPAATMACSVGGVMTIGPKETFIGGSGSYTFLWTASNTALTYLSATNIANPVVSNVPNGTSVTYTLSVTDNFGGCTLPPKTVTVTGAANNLAFSIASPTTICYGEPASIVATVSSPSSVNFIWSTTNYHVQRPYFNIESPNQSIDLTELENSYPGTYTYKARMISTETGCFKEKEVSIILRNDWTHVGYVPEVSTYIQGSPAVPLWKGTTNTISNFNTTPVTPSVTWTPSVPTTIVMNSGTQIPKNGTFTPTLAAPYLTMKVKNTANGCVKDFLTNKYLIANEAPEFWIAADKKVFCLGSAVVPMCFDIQFDAHIVENANSWLPTELQVVYEFSAPQFPASSNKPSKSGFLKLKLNNSTGLYVGQICEANYFTDDTGTGANDPGKKYSLKVFLVGLGADIFGPISTPSYLILVSQPVSGPAVSTCDNPPLGYRLSYDYGKCNGGSGTINLPNIAITAKQYIEIHPNSSLTIVGTNFQGTHFFINDCGGPFFKPPTPDSTSYRSITIDDVVIERSKRATDDDISIYPNPFTNEINVQCQIQGEELVDFSINLYDYSGKLIKNLDRKNKVNPGLYDLKTDLSSLPSGIYFYSLEVQGRSNIVKKSVKI